MESCEGPSIKDIMTSARSPLSEANVATIIREVLQILAYIYKKRPDLCHYNIKASNIYLTKTGIKLGRFSQLITSFERLLETVLIVHWICRWPLPKQKSLCRQRGLFERTRQLACSRGFSIQRLLRKGMFLNDHSTTSYKSKKKSDFFLSSIFFNHNIYIYSPISSLLESQWLKCWKTNHPTIHCWVRRLILTIFTTLWGNV